MQQPAPTGGAIILCLEGALTYPLCTEVSRVAVYLFSKFGTASHICGRRSFTMATDMDIDMDLDVGLMDEEAAPPEMEILPEAEVTVSTLSSPPLHRGSNLTLLCKACTATASYSRAERYLH